MTIHPVSYPHCLLPKEYHPFFLEEKDSSLVSRSLQAMHGPLSARSDCQTFSHSLGTFIERERSEVIDEVQVIVEEFKKHVFRLDIFQSTKMFTSGLTKGTDPQKTIFIVKKERQDIPTTKTANLNRVLVAKKIQDFLKQNKDYQDAFTVVEERLLFCESEKAFYVVGRALDLTLESPDYGPFYKKQYRCEIDTLKKKIQNASERASELSSDTDEETSSEASDRPCSYKSTQQKIEELKNKPFRKLTAIQVKGLTEFAFLFGYTDLCEDNIHFTEDGKVAVLDTEPVKEVVNESFFFNKWIRDRGSLLTQQAIAGVAKLKLLCSTPETLKEVERVERNYVLWSIAKTAMKIALAALAVYSIPYLSLSFLGSAAVSIKLAAIQLLALKVSELAFSMAFTCLIWQKSRQIQGVVGKEEQDKTAIEALDKWQWKRAFIKKIGMYDFTTPRAFTGCL